MKQVDIKGGDFKGLKVFERFESQNLLKTHNQIEMIHFKRNAVKIIQINGRHLFLFGGLSECRALKLGYDASKVCDKIDTVTG